MTDHDELRDRVLNELLACYGEAGPPSWRPTLTELCDLIVEMIDEASRAALATQPQPLFEGTLRDIELWTDVDVKLPRTDPLADVSLDARVVIFAAAGSATPICDCDEFPYLGCPIHGDPKAAALAAQPDPWPKFCPCCMAEFNADGTVTPAAAD
jgi:hypothetical protein